MDGVIEATAPFLTAPGQVELRTIPVRPPEAGEVRVRTRFSGISTGTELLAWEGLLPEEADEIDPQSRERGYPMRAGYAAVGQVIDTGPGVEPALLGKSVFSFQPHGSHFTVRATEAFALPDDVDPVLGTFIPNLETAVNLVMDGRPMIGERVVVLGQGVVGLLVTALLSRFPLGTLLSSDTIERRRALSAEFGADVSLERVNRDVLGDGADLIFELTGNPAALNLTIDLAGFGGRIVVGSWYGNRTAEIDLGGRFHRNRISLISSQVSTVAPELTGRWDKQRRFGTVFDLLPELDLRRLISHCFHLHEAASAYTLLTDHPEEALQVMLTNPDRGKEPACTP